MAGHKSRRAAGTGPPAPGTRGGGDRKDRRLIMCKTQAEPAMAWQGWQALSGSIKRFIIMFSSSSSFCGEGSSAVRTRADEEKAPRTAPNASGGSVSGSRVLGGDGGGGAGPAARDRACDRALRAAAENATADSWPPVRGRLKLPAALAAGFRQQSPAPRPAARHAASRQA